VGRGFTPEVFNYFNLGYCDEGYYKGRAIIPVTHNEKLVSFQARACDPREPKRYLFPAGADSQLLYNWDQARKFESVILVEGVTDAWRVWLAGYRNVMATFGKSLKPGQIDRLIKGDMIRREYWDVGDLFVEHRHEDHIRQVVIMFDGDAVKYAHQEGKKLLGYGKEISIVELPNGMQPDTCPDIEAALRRRVRVKRWI
jgi:DNA primase